MENYATTPHPDSAGWDFSSLGEVWDCKTRAIVAGADKLEALSDVERAHSLAVLSARMRAFTRVLDDNWLVFTAYFMIDDLYKSYFCEFRFTSGIEDYIAATAGVFLQELKQRGFVLHYVIDNIQTEDNLDEMLTFVPAVFQSAGLLVTGPQVMALELMQRIDNRPRDITAIPQYRDEGHRVADMLITECHQNRRSSVYLNLDLDDGTPAFSFDVALSQCNIPGTIVVVRDQAPAPDSPVGIFAPEGVDLSQIVGG